MTAASGGNRESLLGPRPARRKRSAADAGCRNPGSGSASALTERFFTRKNREDSSGMTILSVFILFYVNTKVSSAVAVHLPST